jgi:hypothetical protein
MGAMDAAVVVEARAKIIAQGGHLMGKLLRLNCATTPGRKKWSPDDGWICERTSAAQIFES